MSLDPITFEVVRNALVAATDEMVVSLRRAAYSTNIKTRADFSCAFFDRRLIDLQKEYATALLTRRSSITGLRLVDDPARALAIAQAIVAAKLHN